MYNFSVSTALRAWFDHVLRAGETFRYTDKSAAPVQGIVSVSVRKTRTPGQIKFAVKGKNGSYAVGLGHAPVQGILVLDAPTAETGQCGVAAFTSAACRGDGGTVSCR